MITIRFAFSYIYQYVTWEIPIFFIKLYGMPLCTNDWCQPWMILDLIDGFSDSVSRLIVTSYETLLPLHTKKNIFSGNLLHYDITWYIARQPCPSLLPACAIIKTLLRNGAWKSCRSKCINLAQYPWMKFRIKRNAHKFC